MSRSLPATASALALIAIGLTASASPAAAQTIFYEDGDYLYAVPAPEAAENADDVVTSSVAVPIDPAANTAVRVIPARASAPVVRIPATSVIAPIVLPDVSATPARLPVIVPPAAVPSYAAGPYPGITPGMGYAPQAYPAPTGYLPNGAQLVAFDRQAWIDECRARLATYDEVDRARLFPAFGRAGDYCTSYLDDYVTRASNRGAATMTYMPGQQYMLVPVTVQVAQQTVYREFVAPPE